MKDRVDLDLEKLEETNKKNQEIVDSILDEYDEDLAYHLDKLAKIERDIATELNSYNIDPYYSEEIIKNELINFGILSEEK